MRNQRTTRKSGPTRENPHAATKSQHDQKETHHTDDSNAFKKERNFCNVQSPCCRNALKASIPAPNQEGACVCADLLQSMLNCYSRGRLCDPMDCRPPGSSVHGILQAKILEWIAVPSSRGSSQPWDGICVSFIGRWVLYN